MKKFARGFACLMMGCAHPLTAPAAPDLSRRPIAPENDVLSAMLQQRYPADAKRLGIAGTAHVAVTVGADGHLRDLRVIHELPLNDGFGAACMQVLAEGPAWQPGLDSSGRPRDVKITFECR